MRQLVHALFALILLIPTSIHAAIYSRLDASDGLSDNQVVHILQLEDGRMVFTTHGNINLYDGMRFHYIHRNDSNVYELSNYRGAYHVYIGENDLLWVKDFKRVWCLDVKHERYLDSPESIFRDYGLKDKVLDLFVDSEKRLWFFTEKGLWHKDAKKYITTPSDAGELQDLDVMNNRLYLFFNIGEILCYTIENGTLLYRKAAYTESERHLYNKTSLVVKGNGGIFYQLRYGSRSGFFAFDTSTEKWELLMTSQQQLCTLIVPNEEEAFISTTNGIWQVNLKNGEHQFHASIRLTDGSDLSTTFNTIFRDRQGGIWLGTGNKGIFYTHPERFKFISANNIQELGIEEEYAQALLYEQSHTNSFKGQRYNDVYTDSRGWTWCGTSDGLVLYKSDNLPAQKYYTEDGLTNNFIHAITEDCHQQIWIATSYGLTRINVIGKDENITFTNYRHHEGTLKGEYRNQTAINLPDHRILIEGIDGWTLFHPDSIKFPVQNFCPLLIGLSLHGTPLTISSDSTEEKASVKHAIPYIRHHVFKHHQNNINLDFSALNYAWPSRTHYRYRLIHATDSTWYTARPYPTGNLIDTKGNLHLNYSALQPGEYKMQVMASTEGHSWNGPVTEFSFVILAPWWKTKTAYTIYSLTILFLIIAAIYLYLWQSKQRIMRKHKEDILMLRIQHLIERCDSYERENTDKKVCQPSVEEPPINAHDSIFLNKAVAFVEANLNNPNYTVEQLSKDLCMERSGLYKKLNNLMDKSPSLFIRSIRLKRAANLILEGEMSISEIAEQVGFSSASYMGKCFIEEYHCKPSEYAALHKTTSTPR